MHNYLLVASLSTCELVQDEFYESSRAVDKWYAECVDTTNKIPFTWSKQQVIRWFQAKLKQLNVSHLDLWSPSDMSRTWEGQDLDLGIEVKDVAGHFMVFEVFEQSPAYGLLQRGDEIIAINQQPPQSVWQIENAQGKFQVLRGERNFNVDLQKEKITFDFQPNLRAINAETAVLTLKSFTPVYFDPLDWQALEQEMDAYEKLIIDLRGNTGGDFVVMLSMLSTFFCEQREIGYLHRPKSKNDFSAVFSSNMDGVKQIELVNQVKIIALRTYNSQRCFVGDVAVLIDEETASTAEIFAYAIQSRKGTRVYGQYSAGAVLLAIWFPTAFGSDYSISIPVATYKTLQDQQIEGAGLMPDIFLDYDLKLLREGKDSWLGAVAN